jgi:hypothetical protein
MGRTAFEMLHLLEREPLRCPVCATVGKSLREHIDSLFYERVTDVSTREAIRRVGGFCRYHARLVSEQADALGTGLIVKDLLTNALRDLRGGKYDRPSSGGSSFSRFFEGATRQPEALRCTICEVEDEIDRTAADSLLEGLADGDFRAAFERSPGLCMPHFRLTHERSRDATNWAIVLELQTRRLETQVTELDAFTRSFDHASTEKANMVGSDLWRRALDTTSRESQ